MEPLRKTRSWTPEQRADQSRKLRERKIWLKSTGPRTPEGKAISARNSYKTGAHDFGSRRDRAFIRALIRDNRRLCALAWHWHKQDMRQDMAIKNARIPENELRDPAPNPPSCHCEGGQSPDAAIHLLAENQQEELPHPCVPHNDNAKISQNLQNELRDSVKICYAPPIDIPHAVTFPMNEPRNTSDLTPAAVIDWLQKNPDFLQNNPDALDVLIPPTQKNGRKVVDFQSFMIERLKADKTEAIETVKEIVETARHNMNNQTRIHRAVLRLLEANSFEEFIESITADLTTLLDVDITSLVIESDGHKIPHVTLPGIRIVPMGTLDKWMNGRTILHQSDISGVETVYGAGAHLVRSQVLVRVDISQKTPPAILAFGSRDPFMFQQGQGVEQVTFLAGVVERCIRSWLHLST